jgi:hypothetical protein
MEAWNDGRLTEGVRALLEGRSVLAAEAPSVLVILLGDSGPGELAQRVPALRFEARAGVSPRDANVAFLEPRTLEQVRGATEAILAARSEAFAPGTEAPRAVVRVALATERVQLRLSLEAQEAVFWSAAARQLAPLGVLVSPRDAVPEGRGGSWIAATALGDAVASLTGSELRALLQLPGWEHLSPSVEVKPW